MKTKRWKAKKASVFLGLLAAGAVQAAVLYSNGPVVDSLGKSTRSESDSINGWNANADRSSVVADNFTVTGDTWNVGRLVFYAYQTNASSYGFTTATWSVILGGTPGSGTVLASGTNAVTDGGLVGYRVSNGDPNSIARAIYRVEVDVSDFTLTAGGYWLTWGLDGVDALSGPFVPPTLDNVVGDAMHSFEGTPFVAVTDDRSGRAVDLPFEVLGTTVPSMEVPEPESYPLVLAAGLLATAFVRRRRRR